MSSSINELCLAGSINNTVNLSSAKNKTQLFQSIPSPISTDAKIGYFIATDFSSAVISFTNISGNTMQQYKIEGTGAGSITVNTINLSAGTY